MKIVRVTKKQTRWKSSMSIMMHCVRKLKANKWISKNQKLSDLYYAKNSTTKWQYDFRYFKVHFFNVLQQCGLCGNSEVGKNN